MCTLSGTCIPGLRHRRYEVVTQESHLHLLDLRIPAGDSCSAGRTEKYRFQEEFCDDVLFGRTGIYSFK